MVISAVSRCKRVQIPVFHSGNWGPFDHFSGGKFEKSFQKSVKGTYIHALSVCTCVFGCVNMKIMLSALHDGHHASPSSLCCMREHGELPTLLLTGTTESVKSTWMSQSSVEQNNSWWSTPSIQNIHYSSEIVSHAACILALSWI